jgi:hypothetical protein
MNGIKEKIDSLELALPGSTEVKLILLDKIIDTLNKAKSEGKLEEWVERVKRKMLIDGWDCTSEVAAGYIEAAIEHIS